MNTKEIKHYKVAIIGAGFSGLGMAIKLKQQRENDFILFEKEKEVGGTWYVNHYPGCACDVPSHLYSYSFAPNPEWSRMFAPQNEIKNYLKNCADNYDLNSHIKLETPISTFTWNEKNNYWQLKADNGSAYTADILVMGAGGLSTPAYPDIEGIDSFKGKVFHSQQWDHDYDLTNKKVAVIGTGASAIQFVPEIQKQVGHLDLYQRTPPWIMSKPDRAMRLSERALFKRLPAVQKALRNSIYWTYEARVLAFSINPKLMNAVKYLALKHIRSSIKDRELRKKVTPDYTIGCKRILMSDEYYPALAQNNVSVLTEGIQKIKSNSIVLTSGEERAVDAIIYGTGFKAADPIPEGVIFGKEGTDITATWPDGPEAYKGTCVTGFPNLFFLMGPNTGLGHNSMVYMIESQIQYVLDALKQMKNNNIVSVDVNKTFQSEFNKSMQDKLSSTVWNEGGCQSWYLHPKSGKNVTLWPDFTWRFRALTKHFDVSAYTLVKKNSIKVNLKKVKKDAA